jgi:transposase
MIDRGGEAAEIGQRLLGPSDRWFDGWHRVREGMRARSTRRSPVALLRFSFRDDLRRGLGCGGPKTAATWRELLAGETPLGTFGRVEGVEPMNNDAERTLRPGVRDRKTSGGTDSASGSRFGERILSVGATGRQQGINVLEDLTRCDRAHRDGQPTPSLVPTSSTASQAA